MQPNQAQFNHHSSFVFEPENEHLIEAPESRASGQAHIQTSALDIRAPRSLQVLLEKIQMLDFSTLASMPKIAESQTKYYEEIYFDQESRHFSDHAFSLEYWNDIDYHTDEEKENKIQALMSTCLIEFKDEMSDETKKIFAAQGEFTQYLLSMKDQNNFSDLIKECAQYYALLSTSKNHEVKSKMLVYFPVAQDLACIPGTRTRLQSAMREIKREEGLLDPLDDMIQRGIQRQCDKVFTDYKLYNHIYVGNEIHLQPYLHHILGVSEEGIQKIDQFFSLPHSEITAESMYFFISTLKITVSKTIKDILKEEAADFSKKLSHIEKKGFVLDLLNDLENGNFVRFIKSKNNTFGILGSKYKEAILDKDGEETDEYQWNEPDLYADIFSTLSTIENKILKKSTISFDYKDAFNYEKQIEIALALKSDDLERFRSAIDLLFVLGQSYKGSSPIEFINVLLKASESINTLDKNIEDRCLNFVSELKNNYNSNGDFDSVLGKIHSIKDRLSFYLKDNSGQIHNLQFYFLFLDKKIDLSITDNLSKLINTFIANNASAQTFKMAREFYERNNQFEVNNISNLIAYSPDRKEILQFLSEKMSKKCIIDFFEKSMEIKDHNMLDDFFYFNKIIDFSFMMRKNDDVFFKLVSFCIENKRFDLVEKKLIFPENAINFFDYKYLLFQVITAIKNGDFSVFNKIISSISKEKFFGLESRQWVALVCELIKVGEKGALESLAKNYESDIKTMLFDIKNLEDLESTHTISPAIKQHCLFDSTKTLEMLFQTGCTIEEILSLGAHKNESFISQLIYENIYFYSFGRINRKEVINKRDDTIMWLMEHGCPLRHFQEIIQNYNCSFLRICATEGNFDLLSKMLKKTEDYTGFITLSTSGSENLIFFASRLGSDQPSSLDFIRAALRHPHRNQTLNQPNNDGWTPLHEVTGNGDIDVVALLLEDHHLSVNDIEAKDQRSYTPISIAMTVLQKESNMEKKQQIQRCIEMLENKKQDLMKRDSMI